MMDLLNDDCQLLIINHLPLVDQLALWVATKDTSSRITSNLVYAWRHQLSYSLYKDDFDKYERNPELLDFFLRLVSPTVQRLELSANDLSFLEILSTYQFPSMRALEYELYNTADEYGMELLAKIFPQLNSIETSFSYCFRHFALWKQLRQVDVRKAMYTLTKFDQDYDHLYLNQLTTLEKLTVFSPCFEHINIYSVLCLPKLTTLCFNPVIDTNLNQMNTLFSKVVSHRGKDIEQFTYQGNIWKICEVKTLLQLRNLRQLTLLEHKRWASISLNDKRFQDQVQKVVFGLPQLEQLHLVNVHIWRAESELWAVVAGCKALKLLNITGMKLTTEFFESNTFSMDKALNNRPRPLTLHCLQTGLDDELLIRRFKHPNLELSFKPVPKQQQDWNYMLLQLTPLKP